MISPCKKPLFNEKQMEWIRAMASDSPPIWPGFAKLTVNQRCDLRKKGVPIPLLHVSIDPSAVTDYSKLTSEQRRSLRKRGVPVPFFVGGNKKGYNPGSGAEHHRWGGDAVSVEAGRERARRRYRNIGPCTNCGAEKSERHHADGNTLNNSPENVKILCRLCHMHEDGRLNRLIDGLPKARETRWAKYKESRKGKS